MESFKCGELLFQRCPEIGSQSDDTRELRPGNHPLAISNWPIRYHSVDRMSERKRLRFR
jgi:hypothetical protein